MTYTFDITGDSARALKALDYTTAGLRSLAEERILIKEGPMFERLTDRARRVCVLAQEEARNLNHSYIGTEHMLLGLIAEGEGVAAKALKELNVDPEAIRREVKEIIGEGQPQSTAGHIPYTPRGKKILELSLREALALGHNYIGTEHILLGIIREGEGVGAQTLTKLGVEHARVRQQVMQLLSGYKRDESAPSVSLDGMRVGYNYAVATMAKVGAALPSHSGDVCPKCPATSVSTEYMAEMAFSQSQGRALTAGEYLRRECQTCGYSWREACRTAGPHWGASS